MIGKVRRRLLLLALATGTLAAAGLGYAGAVAEPVVRRISLPLLPPGARPLTLLFATDLHVAGPDMPPARLRRIVGQVNALRPDLVLLGGDFVSDKGTATHRYPTADAVAPLAGLRPRLGSVAVLGNHDWWRGAPAIRAALKRAGVAVLANTAVRRGPLAVGGIDDPGTGHADVPATLAAVRAVGAVPVLLVHNPDAVPLLPDGPGLVFAGHTHCGQIRLPLVGALTYGTRTGARFGCGMIRAGRRTLIVGAGLGTSILPFRIGTPPDLWLVRLTPAAQPPSSPATTSSSPTRPTPHATVRTTGTPAA